MPSKIWSIISPAEMRVHSIWIHYHAFYSFLQSFEQHIMVLHRGGTRFIEHWLTVELWSWLGFFVWSTFFRFENNHNFEKIVKQSDARSLALSNSEVLLAESLAETIAVIQWYLSIPKFLDFRNIFLKIWNCQKVQFWR